ncbi:MAG: hypothetical protein ACI392_06550 [Paludibacteraceae bacterium]
MKIDGKVHCFFEQSGTFKNEFIKLGYDAFDYDIQDNFGQTDYQIDLFAEIEKAYSEEESVFDNITNEDLILAFFPCIYFTGFTNPCYYTLENINYKSMSCKQKFDEIISRSDKREKFYKILYKLCGIVMCRDLRMIIENPYSNLHYLHNNFLKEPTVIDTNRTLRGDYFKKPTGYWFFNCANTIGHSYQKSKIKKIVFDCKRGSKAGICSEERSMISPDYARNFICDFILGKQQIHTLQTLF